MNTFPVINKMKFLLISFVGLLFFILSNAQNYKFEKFGIEKGICHTSVYTINQDKNGYLWIGTGEGLCRFDGFNFRNAKEFDTLPESSVEVCLKDGHNNLWFGHNDGNITLYNGKNFRFLQTDEKISSKISDIKEDDKGNIWLVTQSNGLLRFNEKLDHQSFQTEFQNKWLSSIGIVQDKILIVGTLEGLYIYSGDISQTPLKEIKKCKELEYANIQAIKKIDDHHFYIGTKDDGLYMLTVLKGESDVILEKIKNIPGVENLNIQHIYTDKDNNLWLSTFGNGIFKLSIDQKNQNRSIINYNTQNGLFSAFIKTVFQDREGNIWIGTYDLGMARLMDESITFFDLTRHGLTEGVYSFAMGDNTIWYGGKSCILKENKSAIQNYTLFNRKNGLPSDIISSLYLDGKNSIWIGTSESGLYKMDLGNFKIARIYVSENSLENTINAITGQEEKLYVATTSGVLILNLETGERKRITTTEGLSHNDIKHVYVDSKGIVWVATRSNGLYALNRDIELHIEGSTELEFKCITEDSEENLWAATYGDGIFRFTKDTLLHFTDNNGLHSNYCYSMIGDGEYIWVGHRLGLSRINSKSFSIRSFGTDAGMTGDCNNNAVITNKQGLVLFGTTKNIVQFDRNKEKKNLSTPLINITSIKLNDKDYAIEDIIVPYGLYKLRIDFIGINLTAPAEVQYQYILKGYDLEWSDLNTNSYVQYPRIEDGDYTFLIKACNEDNVWTDKPVTFNIKVRKPFWKTTWFIISAICIGLVAIYLFVKIRERKQIKFQEFLQEKLDERTKEVVEQKEEIESINRDITDSINYAQRIQASILPSIHKLQDNFSGSFVFYLPRDIVSGDFYWFDKTTDDTFIIVCADSTGHGVPGAFMSMIGTTLIKDICQRTDVNSPTQILNVLDYEIQTTLNQNIESGQSSDGMDIIVCEINIKTLRMRYASAMRPLLVYKNNDLTYYKGSQNSIGGEGEKIVKVFEEEEIKLSKGDIIYMFSDGYTDQFGGPHGKKFKMVRLKNLLKDIYEKPMEEQYNFVKSNFELWKDQYPQVDDVLFMGIKI